MPLLRGYLRVSDKAVVTRGEGKDSRFHLNLRVSLKGRDLPAYSDKPLPPPSGKRPFAGRDDNEIPWD